LQGKNLRKEIIFNEKYIDSFTGYVERNFTNPIDNWRIC